LPTRKKPPSKLKGDEDVNVLHMKYAVEVAKEGSINKASEKLLDATAVLDV
jgi:hypothetical protein